MKRLLAMILALAMLVTLVPVAFATGEATNEPAGITVVYNFKAFEGSADSGTISKAIEYDDTYGFWMWRKNYSRDITMKSVHLQYNVRNDINNSASDMDEDDFFLAFEIDIPVSGLYDVTLNNRTYKSYGATAKLYIIPASTANEDLASWMKNPDNKSFGDEFSFCDSTLTKWGEQDEPLGEKYFEAGKYVFAYAVTGVTGSSRTMFVKGITLDGDGETAANYVPIISSLTATENEGVTTVKAETKLMSDAVNSAEDATITYTVATDDATLAEVDATTGVVTGLADGTATIIATATKNGLSSSKSIEVTVTAPPVAEPEETAPEAAPTEINYGVFASDAVCASAVTANGTKLSEATDNIATGTLTPGETLTATAEDNVTGYKFRYWVLGSAATGRYYSSENTVTVNPYANIALTAIYTEVEEETEYLDFFNWNGDYVDSKAIADGKVTALPTATLTGYEFAHWLLEDNVTKLTSENYATTEISDGVSKAMAQYTAVNGYDSSNKPEGTSTTGWTRGGKLVSYSETYEFFKWLNEVGEIEKYAGEAITDKLPLVVLENNGTNYMIEYDKGECEIVEAGILFGSNADVDVKSAYSKATVKNLKPHGQFTAAPVENATASLQSSARGYLMYKDKNDSDKIKVVYSN